MTFVLLLLAGGCASSANVAGSGALQESYVAGFNAVKAATAEAIRTMGLSMEDGREVNDDTYHVTVYEEAYVGNTQQRTRTLTLDIYIERLMPQEVQVRIETKEQTSAYGISLTYQKARRYAESVLSALDDEFRSAS